MSLPHDAVPVFPLAQVTLFPRAFLPLQIFEPRYRAMLKDCLDGPRRMVVTHVRDPEEETPTLLCVAGLGEIVEHQPLPDGRSLILLRGVARVRLDELPLVPPYRRVRVTTIEANISELTPADTAALTASITSFTTEVRKRNPTFDLPTDRMAESHEALIDISTQHLVADVEVRQAVLEELDLTERAHILMRELAMQGRVFRGEEGMWD